MCQYDTATSVRKWLYAGPKFLCAMSSVLLVVLLVTLATRSPLFDSETSLTLANMMSTFKNQPISQIAITTGSDCPSGFEKVTNLGYWAGTNQGCQAEGGWVQNNTCSKGSENTAIPGTRAQNFSLWDGRAFCIQRPKTLYYLGAETKCKSGYTKCSFDSCIDASVESCPIISLELVDISEITEEESEEGSQEGIEEIAFDDHRKLVLKRGTEEDASTFITNIRATLYNSSCINPNQTPLPEMKPAYELSLAKNPGCYPFGSTENRDELDILAARKYLANNGISSATIEKLPNLAEYLEDESAYLSGMKKYAQKDIPECRAVTIADISRCRSIEDEFISDSWPVVILLGLVTLGLIVSIALELFIRVKAAEEQRILLRLVAYLNIGGLGFLFFLFVVNGLIAVNARSDFNPEFLYLKGIRNQQCFIPDEMNWMMSRFVDEISRDIYVIFALDFTLAMMGLGGLALIGILVLADIADLKKEQGYQPIGGNGNGKKKKKHDKNKPEIELLLRNGH